MKDTPGALPQRYWLVEQDSAQLTDGGVIEESLLDLYVNGQELATIMCSPLQQEALALGFLYTEGVIDTLAEVALVQANLPRTVVDVLLTRADFAPPRRMVLTSGCGGGVTLQHITESYPPLCSDFRAEAAVIQQRMRDLQGAARLYQLVRGVHIAVLADTQKLLLSAEDVGRHNAVDKIAGMALQADVDPRDCLLLTSGPHQLGDAVQGAAHEYPAGRQPHRAHQHRHSPGRNMADLHRRLCAPRRHARLHPRLAPGPGRRAGVGPHPKSLFPLIAGALLRERDFKYRFK